MWIPGRSRVMFSLMGRRRPTRRGRKGKGSPFHQHCPALGPPCSGSEPHPLCTTYLCSSVMPADVPVTWQPSQLPPLMLGLSALHNCITGDNFRSVPSAHAVTSVSFSAVSSTKPPWRVAPTKATPPPRRPCRHAGQSPLGEAAMGSGVDHVLSASLFTALASHAPDRPRLCRCWWGGGGGGQGALSRHPARPEGIFEGGGEEAHSELGHS